VRHGATLQPVIVPGSIVSIFGSYLAAPELIATQYDETGHYPKTLGDAVVTMNGVVCSLLYVSPTQINALVPSELAGAQQASVVVRRFNRSAAAFSVPVRDRAVGLFTVDQSGTGQAVIRQVGAGGGFSFNGADNPAPPGAAFEVYATGIGLWDPPFLSDIALIFRVFTPLRRISVTVGGQPARLLYAGTQGRQGMWAVFQANAVVPEGVGSGPQRVVLRLDDYDNSAQDAVIHVR
jgi:uncharacterized protein (TIGR03437 family)